MLVSVGCSSKKQNNDSDSQITSEIDDSYAKKTDERNYEFYNLIDEPDYTIHNMDDFMKVTDYNAFYKNPAFTVNVADDYVYSTTQKTAKSELNYLYWYSELVNGVMGFSIHDNNNSTWTVTFEFYKDAYIDSNETYPLIQDILYEDVEIKELDSSTTFSCEDETLLLLDVATSQQLWYALEHGYRVNCLEDSPAEYYYLKAKEVVNSIIKDDMDEYDIAKTIYDYIEHHATYCYEALDAMDSDDMDNFPDRYCSGYKAFYIEGFFDNHSVVCDGFAKTYTLLGRIAGLNIVRGTGTPDRKYESKMVAGHAYCFVEIDGTYYLSCPTWGQTVVNSIGTLLHHSYFLSPESYIGDYSCEFWNELNYTNTENNKRYFEDRHFEYDDAKYSTYIDSSDDFDVLFNFMNELDGTYQMNVLFSSQTLRSNFIDTYSNQGVNFLSLRSSYELILLKR